MLYKRRQKEKLKDQNFYNNKTTTGLGCDVDLRNQKTHFYLIILFFEFYLFEISFDHI